MQKIPPPDQNQLRCQQRYCQVYSFHSQQQTLPVHHLPAHKPVLAKHQIEQRKLVSDLEAFGFQEQQLLYCFQKHYHQAGCMLRL